MLDFHHFSNESVDEVYVEGGRQAILAIDTPRKNKEELIKSHTDVTDKGWACLHSNLHLLDEKQAQWACVWMAALQGEVTRTTQTSQRLAWPIHVDLSTKRKTFSQTTDEALPHTDTQYYQRPEQRFLLACMHADIYGRGINHLIHVDDIIPRLSADVIKSLMQPFPFRAPSIFTLQGQDDEVEILWAPILSLVDKKWHIRFREDTIRDAFSHVFVEEQKSLTAMDELLNVIDSAPRQSLHLQPGNILLVDNTRVLHSRSAFHDQARLLYRVRYRT